MKKARLLCELTSSENFLFGGDEEDRTPDLCIANAALSQLSYTPKYTIKQIHLNGGHKWTRTIDLTLIRRAL